MNPKLKLFLFVVSLVALLLFQSKAVMPLVYDVIASDIFLQDSPDQGSQMTVSNEMTDIAFKHCNTYVSEEIDTNITVTFSDAPTNAWAMGNYQYIVNADMEVVKKDEGNRFTRSYVCRIDYSEKEDLSQVDNYDNWSINGFSGLDDL
ncbi:MAG: hypothetical protein KAG26_01355 [Methylococcales bacterium]|nr:hypothetical protein [Methylococcales bacterium]